MSLFPPAGADSCVKVPDCVSDLDAVIALPFALAPWKTVRSGALGPDLIPVLAATGRLQLAYGLLLTVGIFASR